MGGYPLSGTINVGNASGYTSTNISDKIFVETWPGSITNLNYEFSNRTLRLYGSITKPAGSNANGFMIGVLRDLQNHQGIYTCKASSNSPESVVIGIAYGSPTYYFKNKDTLIFKYTSSSRGHLILDFLNQAVTPGKTTTFDITIDNVVLYEGAYTNPPFCKSIAQLNNEGLMDNFLTRYTNLSASVSTYDSLTSTIMDSSGWYKVLRVGVVQGGNTIGQTYIIPQAFKIILNSGWYNEDTEATYILEGAFNSNTGHTISSYLTASYIGNKQDFTKARIKIHGSWNAGNAIYLEIYKNTSIRKAPKMTIDYSTYAAETYDHIITNMYLPTNAGAEVVLKESNITAIS